MRVRGILLLVLFGAVSGLPVLADWAIDVGPQQKEAAPRRKIDVPKPARDGGGARPAAGPRTDILRFLNGDLLSGRLNSIDPTSGIVWQHPDVAKPISFAPANVDEITLAGDRVDRTPGALSRVELTNGDSLMGRIIELTPEKLVLDTTYGGQLSLERRMLRAIAPNVSVSSYIYEGPTGLEGWTLGNNRQGTWRFSNGAFYSDGGYQTLGREMKLPDLTRIDMDLAWRGQLNFYFYFYTDRYQDYGQNAYMFYVSHDYVYMQRRTQNRGSNDMGNQHVNGLNNRGKTRVTLLCDKKKKTFTLLLDGVVTKTWIDSQDWAGGGTALMFNAQNNSQIKISNLRISKWDGNAQQKDASAGKAGSEDLMRFTNDDKVSGRLESIKNGKITFKTAYATLDVPVDRAVAISFADKDQARARRNANDVQAHFADGGHVTMELRRLAGGNIEGSSENFGEGRFRLNAFNRVVLNVYAKREKEEADW